jgi:hypothetical protein
MATHDIELATDGDCASASSAATRLAKLIAMTTAALISALPVMALADSDGWQYQGTLYVYAPSISGESKFPESGGGSSASIDGEDILNALEFAFMGAFEARRQDWGVLTDLIYLNLGASASGSRDITIGGSDLPVGAAANIDYDLQGWAWTVSGNYRIAGGSKTLDLLAGARLLDIESGLKWQVTGDVSSVPVVDRQGAHTSRVHNVDAIVGCKGRMSFGDRQAWFVPYYLDVGTGESDLTWQAMAGLGYTFDWGDFLVALRYLDYDLPSDSTIKSVTFNGPTFAVSFRW